MENGTNDSAAAWCTQRDVRRPERGASVAMKHKRGAHAAQRALAAIPRINIRQGPAINTDGGADQLQHGQYYQ